MEANTNKNELEIVTSELEYKSIDEFDLSINSDTMSKHVLSSKATSVYDPSEDESPFFKTNTINGNIQLIPGASLKRINTLKASIVNIDKNVPNWMVLRNRKDLVDSKSVSKNIQSSDYTIGTSSDTNKDDSSKIFDLRVLSVSYLSENFSNLDKSNFTKLKHIANGSRCNIFKAYLEKNQVILKVMKDFNVFDPMVSEEVSNEIDILSRINHKNIVLLYGTGSSPSQSGISGFNRLFMVLEPLYGGSLSYHLKLKRSFYTLPFSELRYLRIAKELADALYYLHELVHPECTLIHRDLKPDNIGFTSEGVLKLIDFGSSVTLTRCAGKMMPNCRMSEYYGSLRYMAPESVLNKPYDEKIDIYSYGLIIYEITTGCAPYTGLSRENLPEKVFIQNYRPSFEYDAFGREIRMSESIKQLIKKCWSSNPVDRPTAKTACEIFTNLEAEAITKKNSQSTIFSTITTTFSKKDTI